MTQAQQLHPRGTAEDEVTSQFYIPAVSSLQERRLRALKHGDSFALFNHYGDIVPFRGAPDGLYHCDTRYLSHPELRLNGQQPLLLSSTVHETMRCSRPISRTSTCSASRRSWLEDLAPDDEVWQRVWLLYCMYEHDCRRNRYLKVFEGRTAVAAPTPKSTTT